MVQKQLPKDNQEIKRISKVRDSNKDLLNPQPNQSNEEIPETTNIIKEEKKSEEKPEYQIEKEERESQGGNIYKSMEMQ